MKTKQILLRPRWLLLFIVWASTLFASPPEARAQNAEFAPIGAKWWYAQRSPLGPPDYWTVTMKCIGNTLIENTACKILELRSLAFVDTLYIHEQNGLVKLYDGQDFFTLYDFNAEVGDAWNTKIISDLYSSNYYDVTAIVDSINYQTIEGVITKNQYIHFIISDSVEQQLADETGIWMIENTKINSLYGATPFFIYNFLILDDGGEGVLHCYQDDAIAVTLEIDPYYANGSDDCDYSLVYGVDDGSADTPIEITAFPEKLIFTIPDFSVYDTAECILLSSNGQILAQFPVREPSAEISTAHLAAGVYMILFKNTVNHQIFYTTKFYKS